MHIYLTGFMGSGKSVIGRTFCRLHNMPNLDTDVMIEEKDGRRISKIFEQSGEGYFRRLESMVLRELLEKESAIISCGGGIVLRDENVELMRQGGRIIYLKTSPEEILQRVQRSNARPLLEGNKNIEFIREMMDKRTPFYEKAADICVITDEKSPEEIADEIFIRVNLELA